MTMNLRIQKLSLTSIITLLVLGCSSTPEEMNQLSIYIPNGASERDVYNTLGNPIKSFKSSSLMKGNYSALYYCANPEWNTRRHRYVFLKNNVVIGQKINNVRGVVCDKRIPHPSFSGVKFNEFDIYLPRTKDYGADIYATCMSVYTNPRYKNITETFEINPSKMKAIQVKKYSNPDAEFDEIEKLNLESIATITNECSEFIAIKKYVNTLGPIPKTIRGKVEKEILDLFAYRTEMYVEIFNKVTYQNLSLAEVKEEFERVNKVIDSSETDLFNYIYDFKEKIAIAHAGKAEIKINVRSRTNVNTNTVVPAVKVKDFVPLRL